MSEQIYNFGNVGEIVDSIAKLIDGRDEDATRFLEQYVDDMEDGNTEGWDRDKCREVCLQNIGYCAGYINMEAISRVNQLMGATHIAFGTGKLSLTIQSPIG